MRCILAALVRDLPLAQHDAGAVTDRDDQDRAGAALVAARCRESRRSGRRPRHSALAGRRPSEWANADWPDWENLAYLAGQIHDQVTGAGSISVILADQLGTERQVVPALVIHGGSDSCDGPSLFGVSTAASGEVTDE